MADWFRNKTWDDTVERAFNAKLRRARGKGQYLRIQASTLATSHPLVALRLLDLYFALPEDFDHAQAHVDRATAYLALGRTRDAVDAYEAALAREAAFPKLQTQAYLNLPYLVATLGLKELYDRAVTLLDEHQNRLVFPVDHFRWNVSYALIASDLGEAATSRVYASKALRSRLSGKVWVSISSISGPRHGAIR
jgi:tetratricopeptide (TPR) repeat protein